MATDRRRWVVLGVGMLAMTAACTFQFGLPFLIPAFRDAGMSLTEAGLLAAAPTAGLLPTLIAWGAAADRWGERVVLTTGLTLAGGILLAATQLDDTVALGVVLLLAGAAGGSVHASSGRLILGWFAARERGLAMGLRQTAQPLGVAVGALLLPTLAVTGGLLFMGLFSLVAAALVGILVRDPAPSGAAAGADTGSPYRTPVLWRIHAASTLLVVPQFTVATFALVFLVEEHGWRPDAAGRVLAIGQAAGAVMRLVAGWWSDRAGSRTRPMRVITLAIAAVMALLAATSGAAISVVALMAASVLTVGPNGLAFTAVAEYAGRSWAGRALGIHNTAQNTVASATPPAMAALIGAAGYGAAFAAAVVFPLLAAVIIPMRTSRAEEPAPRTIKVPATTPGPRPGG
ncbi:MFS transporter [Actinoplanes ianthinogenes]|uniref:MFS transporter n=1 Tax=Actinoplanes ianthinogenes TaxID=122358 RepID=A0ABM7LPQ3_9ACTN|nr:MFS transporter [Actinoplanes ianthinogenes]BCJ41222.1 MFS transporter [Actinoplanes ianthinogenes]GGR22094.1 MFS transporter [Actinoplanes ianthinogenes]